MPACRVYLINLDRSPDRLAPVAGQLTTFGFDWVRIRAVDGKTLGPPPWPDFDERGFDRVLGKAPNANELGCYFSHIAAMRAFLADGGDAAIILEDDARLTEQLPHIVDDLLARRDEWDLVKLAGFHRGLPTTMRALPGGHRLVTFLSQHRGSAGYMLTRRAAECYVANLLPMNLPYDHALEKAWRFGIRMRGVLPHPILDGGYQSTIGLGRGKKPWHRRGSVLAYRLGNEFRRAFHYLFTDNAWMSIRRNRAPG